MKTLALKLPTTLTFLFRLQVLQSYPTQGNTSFAATQKKSPPTNKRLAGPMCSCSLEPVWGHSFLKVYKYVPKQQQLFWPRHKCEVCFADDWHEFRPKIALSIYH